METLSRKLEYQSQLINALLNINLNIVSLAPLSQWPFI